MTCTHNHGKHLTYGLASGQRATVFCLVCREALLWYVTPVEARAFIDEYRSEHER